MPDDPPIPDAQSSALGFILPNQFPDSGERGLLISGLVKAMSAMIRKVRNVEVVVPTVFAVALAIVLSIGAIYLTEIIGPIERVEPNHSVAGSGGITDLPN